MVTHSKVLMGSAGHQGWNWWPMPLLMAAVRVKWGLRGSDSQVCYRPRINPALVRRPLHGQSGAGSGNRL